MRPSAAFKTRTRLVARNVASAIALGAGLAGCMMEMETTMVDVTREEFGEAWPLTVSEGQLSCRSEGEVTFQWRGTEYTLTGGEQHSAYADVDRIRADDPDGTGKKDLDPLVRRGRELCTT